jgi:hypothetical protein
MYFIESAKKNSPVDLFSRHNRQDTEGELLHLLS